jgi:hypothetical protein
MTPRCVIAGEVMVGEFTVPPSLTLMLAAFRSRWTMPCPCAAFDQFHDERRHARALLEPMNLGDLRVIERGRTSGFALEPRQPLRIRGEGVWQHLGGNRPLQVRVARGMDLAHAAHANQRGHLIRAETRPGGYCHRVWDG